MQQVTLSFRTDFYALNMTSGMGVPRHLNGDRIISAALEVAESEADRPSNTVPVRFNNTSGFHVVTDVTEQNSAMDAQGRVWYGGPGFETTITAYPVLYSAGTVQSVTLNFCTSGSESTAPYTFSRTCTGTETIATGIVPMLSSIVSGNTGPTAILNGQARFGLAPHPFPVRIDRVAPGLGTGATLGVFEWRTDTAIQNRENWVNAQYRLDRTTVTAPTDVGVGMSTTVTNARTFVVRSAADTMVVLSEGSGNTAHASLDNSIDNNAYQLQQRWVDLLGNTRSVTVVASGSFTTIDDAVNNNTFGKATFGIDMEAPEAEIVSDFEDTETFLLLNGGETFDTEAVDVISGFAAPLSGHAFDHLLVRVNGTPGSSMLTRTSVASTGTISTTPFATSGADNTIAGLVPVTTYIRTPTSLDYSGQVGPTSDPGYFIYQARVRDKAGNTSPLMTRWVYNSENSAPEVSSVAVTTALQGGQPVAFPAVGSDDVELWQGSFDMDYAGARLVYNRPAPQISTLFDDVITIPAIFSFAADAFIRSLHVVDVLNAPAGVGAKPSIINAIAYNGWAFEADPSHVDASVGVSAANGNSNTFAAAVNAALVEDGVDWASMDAQLQINEWRPVSFSTGAVSGGNVTATVRVRARGPTSTFQNPFAAVLVVEADGAFITPLDIALTPNFNAPFPTTDSGTDRDYEWTFTITRPVGDVADLHVVGLNTGFDALATQVFTISFVASTPVTPLP